MVILQSVICDAVELHCVILRGVSYILPNYIKKGRLKNIPVYYEVNIAAHVNVITGSV